MSIIPMTRGVLRDVVTLREAMDRLFEDSVGSNASGVEPIRVDLREDADSYVLTANLPGIPSEDVDIRVTPDTISIVAETERTEEQKDDRVILSERVYGRFQRTLPLPSEIDPDKVDASFENGVLRVKMPKAAASRPRKIEPRTASSGTAEKSGTQNAQTQASQQQSQPSQQKTQQQARS